MRGLVVLISSILLLFFLLDKSGAFRMVPYNVREGTYTVEKTRPEWHPERIQPYLKRLYLEWVEQPIQKGIAFFNKDTPFGKTSGKTSHRLVLKDGLVLKGQLISRDEKGILFESDGGRIFFEHDEIISLEKE